VTSSDDRYARQRILNEIGSEGQIRLGQASVCAPGYLSPGAADDFDLYAKRAGLGMASRRSAKSDETSLACQALAQMFRHQESRQLGLGAAACLEAIHEALRPSSSATKS